MAAGNYDINIEYGETLRRPILMGSEAGVPANLTGYTARLWATKDRAQDPILLELTISNGGIIVDALAGSITLYLSDTAVKALTFTTCNYFFEVRYPSGDVVRFLEGKIRKLS